MLDILKGTNVLGIVYNDASATSLMDGTTIITITTMTIVTPKERESVDRRRTMTLQAGMRSGEISAMSSSSQELSRKGVDNFCRR
jgi:hypothetical protein